MRKFKKALISVLLAAVTVLSCAGTALAGEADAAGFAIADPGENIDMHTQLQRDALADFTEIRDYVQGKEELSAPQGVVLNWTYDGEQPEAFIIRVSTNEDMSEAAQYTYVPENVQEGYEYAVLNLLLGQTYYFTVSAGENISDVHTFSTGLIPPRNIYIENVPNVRDLGGWETENGGHIRQGMLYRTAALFTDDERYTTISDLGIEQMRAVINPKTEIDVRGVDDGETAGQDASPLGDDVQYLGFPMYSPFKMTYQDTTFNEPLKGVLQAMADKENYPIVYHCAVGTDRTGFISMLILGVCGVSQDDILRDYVFSSFAGIGTMRDDSNLASTIRSTIEPYDGDTLSEKIRNFMLDIGLTDEEIDNIVAIMVEE